MQMFEKAKTLVLLPNCGLILKNKFKAVKYSIAIFVTHLIALKILPSIIQAYLARHGLMIR